MLKILQGRFIQFAKITTGNNFEHYPFGKKGEPNKGSTEVVQAFDAWKAAALNVNFYISPVHRVLLRNSLTTKLMTHVYHGFTGKFIGPNKGCWTDEQFKRMFDDLCDRQGYPPVTPRLAAQTYPRLYEKLKEFEEPRPVPLPKAMPKAAREKMDHKAPETSEIPVITISDTESDWGSWSRNDPSTKTMTKDDPVADPAGDPHGASPVGKATRAIPVSWKDKRPEVWEENIALIELGERDTAYLSKQTLLLEKANELFGQARQTARGMGVVDWPMPLNNADGTDLVENAEPFDKVAWKQEEYFIIGGTDEQHDPEHDGFLMMEQMKALHFETDRYSDCAGYLGYITKDWNKQGMTHASGLKLLSLTEGDIVAMSFPLARNVSDDIAQKFSEEEYQYFAIGQKMRVTSTDDVTCGVFDT